MKKIFCLTIAGVVCIATACNTDPVGNLNTTSAGFTPAGYQARLYGVLNDLRSDYANRTLMLEAFARNAGNFTTTDNEFITQWLGDGAQIPDSRFTAAADWVNQFNVMRQAQGLLQVLPAAAPAYSANDMAKWKGMIYTFEALAFINLEVDKDTLGLGVMGPFQANPQPPAPILCSRDVWKFIVALLDSGLTQLNVDPGPGLPVTLPSGFAAVGAQASPSTTVGAFAAFNRAGRPRQSRAGLRDRAFARGGVQPTDTHLSRGAGRHRFAARG